MKSNNKNGNFESIYKAFIALKEKSSWWSAEVDCYNDFEKKSSNQFLNIPNLFEAIFSKEYKKSDDKKINQMFKLYMGKISLMSNPGYLLRKKSKYLINLWFREALFPFKKQTLKTFLKDFFLARYQEISTYKRHKLKKAPYISDMNFILFFKPFAQYLKYNDSLRGTWLYGQEKLKEKEMTEKFFNLLVQETDELFLTFMADDIWSFLTTWYSLTCYDVGITILEEGESEELDLLLPRLANLIFLFSSVLKTFKNSIKHSKNMTFLRYKIKKLFFISSKTIFLFPTFERFFVVTYKILLNLIYGGFIHYIFKSVPSVFYFFCNLFVILYYKFLTFFCKAIKFFIIAFQSNYKKLGDNLTVISTLFVFSFYSSAILFNFASCSYHYINLYECISYLVPVLLFTGILYSVLKKDFIYSLFQSIQYIIVPFSNLLVMSYAIDQLFRDKFYIHKFNETFVDFISGVASSQYKKDFKKFWSIKRANTIYITRWQNRYDMGPTDNKKSYLLWKEQSELIEEEAIVYQHFVEDIPLLNYLIQLLSEPFSFSKKFQDPFLDYYKGSGVSDYYSSFAYYCNHFHFPKIILKTNYSYKSIRASPFKVFTTKKNIENVLFKHLLKRKKKAYKVFGGLDKSENKYNKINSLWGYDQYNCDIVLNTPYYSHYSIVQNYINDNIYKYIHNKVPYKRKLFKLKNPMKGQRTLVVQAETGWSYQIWTGKVSNLSVFYGNALPEAPFIAIVNPYTVIGPSFLFSLIVLSYVLILPWLYIQDDKEETDLEAKDIQKLNKKEFFSLEKEELEEIAVLRELLLEEPGLDSLVQEQEEEYFDWYQNNYINSDCNEVGGQKFALDYYKSPNFLDSMVQQHSFNVTDQSYSLISHNFLKKSFQNYFWNTSIENTIPIEDSEIYEFVYSESTEKNFLAITSGFYEYIVQSVNIQLPKFSRLLFKSKYAFGLLLSNQQNLIGFLKKNKNLNLGSNFYFKIMDRHNQIQWLCDQWFDDEFLNFAEPDSTCIVNTMKFSHIENSTYISKKLNYLLEIEKNSLIDFLNFQTFEEIPICSTENISEATVSCLLNIFDNYDKNLIKIHSMFDYYVVHEYSEGTLPSEYYWEVCYLKLTNSFDIKEENFIKFEKLKEFLLEEVMAELKGESSLIENLSVVKTIKKDKFLETLYDGGEKEIVRFFDFDEASEDMEEKMAVKPKKSFDEILTTGSFKSFYEKFKSNINRIKYFKILYSIYTRFTNFYISYLHKSGKK